jgi:hypothetical protein
MTGTDCVNKSQFVPVIFKPPCTSVCVTVRVCRLQPYLLIKQKPEMKVWKSFRKIVTYFVTNQIKLVKWKETVPWGFYTVQLWAI